MNATLKAAIASRETTVKQLAEFRRMSTALNLTEEERKEILK